MRLLASRGCTDDPCAVAQRAGCNAGMFLGKIMSEHHGLHGGTQRLQQVFTLVGYTAGQPDDLREKMLIRLAMPTAR